MNVMRWQNPPQPRIRPVHDWAGIGSALRARPGEWAIVAVVANAQLAGSTARHVRAGAYQALRDFGRFEAVARTVDGEHRIYARYAGPLESP